MEATHSSRRTAPSDLAQAAPVAQRLRSPPIQDGRALRQFQDSFSDMLNGICVEPLQGQPLAIDCSMTTFGDTAIRIGRTSPTRCTHPSEAAADDALVLMAWPRGRATLRAGSAEWDVVAGDAMVVQSGQSQALLTHTHAHMYSVTLSRSMLGGMYVDVDAMLLRTLRGNAAVAMLVGYAHLLRDLSVLATPALRRGATLHLHDLAALAVCGAGGDPSGVAHAARARGGRAARLLAVRKDIAMHFTDAALSAAVVARRQGITPRYLHMLLEDEGLSFSALVLERRLNLAHRLLGDRQQAGRSIGALAFDVGFGDLSYFNRSFRRRFGATPSDVRAQALAWQASAASLAA